MKVQDLHQEILYIELQIHTDRFHQDCVHNICISQCLECFENVTDVATVLKVIKTMLFWSNQLR